MDFSSVGKWEKLEPSRSKITFFGLVDATNRSMDATNVTTNDSFGLTNVLFLQIFGFLNTFAAEINFANLNNQSHEIDRNNTCQHDAPYGKHERRRTG